MNPSNTQAKPLDKTAVITSAFKNTKIMTTDEMLIEIVNYNYKSAGFPYVFLDYSQSFKYWAITWRNPIDFSNEKQTNAPTPNEACKKALEFIKSNPSIFSRSNQAG